MSELSQNKEFIKFKETIESAKRILISTHLLPDGDGLGAEVALYHYLKRAKKTCKVYNPDPLPKRYKFLDPKAQFLHGPNEAEMWDNCDLWIIVDTNDPRRLGKLWDDLKFRAKKIVFLDHHPETLSMGLELKYPPNASLVCDTSCSSIGELLHHLFKDLNLAKINHDVATGLYVSVMTDTNSFRYARTTPEAHRIAAEMIALEVNPEEVYQAIYSSKEVTHLQLLGYLLQNVKVLGNGRLAWMELDLETRKKYRATADDTQSFMNLLLLLKDAEVVMLFREEDEGMIRGSIRSKGRVIVNKLAMEFGGGGHEYAAGFALPGPLSKVVDQVSKKMHSVIEQFEKFGK